MALRLLTKMTTPGLSEPNLPGTDGLTRKSFSGTGWTSLATAGRQILSMISVAVLARLLGPDAYGLMGMAALFFTFLLNFRDLGTAAAVIRMPSISSRLLSSLFWVNLAFGTALTLVVVLLAAQVAGFFHEPRLTGILRLLSVSFILFAAGAVQNAVLSREMSFGKIAAVELGSAVAGFVVAVPCALAGLGVQSLVFANLATAVTSAGLCWTACRWRPKLEIDFAELKLVTPFSLNFAGFGLINYFGRNADNIVVGRYLGEVQLGYYQMAYNLMLYPIQNVTSVISQVLLPAFSKIQDDNDRFRSAYVRSCMLISLVTFPLIAGLGVVADPLVRAVLGQKWLPAIRVFQILAPLGMVQSILATVGQIYVSKGRTDWMLRWGIYSSLVSVASFLIGVRFGITGVAGAYTAASLTLLAYPGFAIPFRLIELRMLTFGRELFPQLIITAAMAGVCILWMKMLFVARVTSPAVHLASTAGVGFCAYVSLMLWLRPGVMRELEKLLIDSSSGPAALLLRIIGRAGSLPPA